jgi:hypothetical protein
MPTKVTTTGRAKSFTIDRAKWLQGGLAKRDPKKFSTLRNSKGEMCCLGFYSKACGATGLTDMGLPNELAPSERKKLHQDLFKTGFDGYVTISKLCGEAVEANDDEHLSDTRREQRVTARFAKLGIKVKFKGKYPYAK